MSVSTMIPNNCNNIEVIPQSHDIGICWFNSILTICLYSQGCRRVLLEASHTWDKKNKILMIIKRFIHKYYYKSEAEIKNFFKKLNPEFLLLEFLKTFDLNFLELNKRNIHFIIHEGWVISYIAMVFKALNINYKDIVITEKYKYQDILEYINIGIILYNLKIQNKISVKNPSFVPNLIIYSDKKNINNNDFFNSIIKDNKNIFKFNKFDDSNFDDTRLDQEIIYNGEIYKLDACIMRNYNNLTKTGHIIAGITCDGKRYIYDGQKIKGNPNPCKLFEYDWHINENKIFKINYNTCNLDEIYAEDNRYQLFSFLKGTRLLIYVKESYYDKQERLRLFFTSSTPILNKKNLLDYIYNFNDLNGIVNKLKSIYTDPTDIDEIDRIKGNIRKLRDFIYMKLNVKTDTTPIIGKQKKSSTKSPLKDTKRQKTTKITKTRKSSKTMEIS